MYVHLNHRQMRIGFCRAAARQSGCDFAKYSSFITPRSEAMKQLLYGHNVMKCRVYYARGTAEKTGETVLVDKVSVDAATTFS